MDSEDIIHQLPINISNQIAAGEVIQNPASVVKELLENSIDAHSDEIILNIKDGGKTLIQVIDNGIGMSKNDAIMSLKKHATSKIHDLNDLYSINTMGFRGEAIASIISIAQVEIITKTQNTNIGTKLIVEDSKIISQEDINCNKGTIFNVKNIFFNTPVRRTFLKSNNIEYNFILHEFQHIALAYPDISLKLINNDVIKYDLKKTSLLQRITDLFPDKNKSNLIPFQEDNEFVNISGFLLNPSKVKKKEDNFIFVNKRFIKNYNIRKSILDAYEDLILKDRIPFFVIFIEVHPRDIDININPSKTDIRFKNEEFIFSLINKVVRKALFYYEIPILDFENKDKINSENDVYEEYQLSNYSEEVKEVLNFEDFKEKQCNFENKQNENKEKYMYKNNINTNFSSKTRNMFEVEDSSISNNNFTDILKYKYEKKEDSNIKFLITNDNYIVSTVKSGLLIINIDRAINRIKYDEIYTKFNKEEVIQSQQLLFPQDIFLPNEQILLLNSKYEILNRLGFTIIFCDNCIKITGLPDFIDIDNIINYIEDILFLLSNNDEKNIFKYIIQSIIKINKKTYARNFDANKIINNLFKCSENIYDQFGCKIFTILDKDSIESLF